MVYSVKYDHRSKSFSRPTIVMNVPSVGPNCNSFEFISLEEKYYRLKILVILKTVPGPMIPEDCVIILNLVINIFEEPIGLFPRDIDDGLVNIYQSPAQRHGLTLTRRSISSYALPKSSTPNYSFHRTSSEPIPKSISYKQ